MYLIVIAFLVFLASYLGVNGFCYWAKRWHILDIPSSRSSHSEPTPRGGGLIIVLITLLGGCFFYFFIELRLSQWAFWSYIGGGLLIAGVSWVDDLYGVSYRIRFLVQSVAAVMVLWGIGVPAGEYIVGTWIGAIFVFAWIIGLTNAYNFMDGIDGMAGGQAVVAGAGWWWLGAVSGYPFLCALGFLLVFSSLGFLGHNWPPARIFMGDVGSAFLGFSFGVMSLFAAQVDLHLFWVGGFLVWPFIFDTFFTFLRRLCLRENVFQAHRSHLYQRLVIQGVSHQKVSILYMMLAVLYGMMVLPFYQWFWAKWIGVGCIVLFCMGLWVVVVRLERRA